MIPTSKKQIEPPTPCCAWRNQRRQVMERRFKLNLRPPLLTIARALAYNKNQFLKVQRIRLKKNL